MNSIKQWFHNKYDPFSLGISWDSILFFVWDVIFTLLVVVGVFAFFARDLIPVPGWGFLTAGAIGILLASYLRTLLSRGYWNGLVEGMENSRRIFPVSFKSQMLHKICTDPKCPLPVVHTTKNGVCTHTQKFKKKEK